MKGLVMEVRDGYSAVFREDGVVVKIRQSCQVGETIELPEARNALNAISAGVGALGAKLSRGKPGEDAQSFDATADVPPRQAPTPRADVEPEPEGADATEIISDTVRDALDDAPSLPREPEPVGATGIISDTVRDALDDAPPVPREPEPVGATGIISDTVRDALDNRETEADSDASERREAETVWDSPDDTQAVGPRKRTPAVDLWKAAVAAQAAPGDSDSATDDGDIQAAATDITSTIVWDDAPAESASAVENDAPAESAPRKSPRAKKPRRAARFLTAFAAALQVREAVKESEGADAEQSADGKPKRRKNPWIQGAIAAALALVILSGSVTYNTAFAASYVSLDVDESSVEFAVNRMGRVISVKPISSDAQGLAQSIENGVKNKKVDDAVSYAMDTLKDAGYLDTANGEIIASVTSDTEKREMELTQTVAQSMDGHRQDGLKVYLMAAGKPDRQAALARKVSPGRYLIRRSGMDAMPPRNDDSDASAAQVSENPAPPETPDAPDVDALPQGETAPLSESAQPADSGATANGVPVSAAEGAAASAQTAAATTDNGNTQTPAASATPANDAGNTQSAAPRAQTPATSSNNKTTSSTNSTKTNNKTSSTANNKTTTTAKNNTTTSKNNSKTTTTTKPKETTTVTKPAATPAPKPQAEPAPTVTPAPQPEPEPAPTVAPEPESKPVQQPEPEPESVPAPQQEPEPESRPVRQPEPEPEPETRLAEREPEETWKAPESRPSGGGQNPSNGGQPSGGDPGETTGHVVREEREPVKEPTQPDDGETTAPKPANETPRQSEPEPVRETPRQSEPEPEPVRETPRQSEPEPVRETPRQSEPEPESVRETPRQSEPEPVRETPRQSEPEPVRETPRQSEPEPVRETPRQSEPEPVRETPRQSEPEPVRETPKQSEPEPVRETPKQSEPEPEPESVRPSNSGGGESQSAPPPAENPENEMPS